MTDTPKPAPARQTEDDPKACWKELLQSALEGQTPDALEPICDRFLRPAEDQ